VNHTDGSCVTHSKDMGTERSLSGVSAESKEMTMHLFRDRGRPTDPLWEVASATRILVADPTTVTSLSLESDPSEPDADVDGVLVASRHPTGWFLHAVRRDDLSADELAPFRELVIVRSYLLLAHGPGLPAWRPSPVEGEWRSVWYSLARELSELSELDDTPVD
jgi:hypothetical protein